MNALPDDFRELFERAADLRAGGTSWRNVAEQLGQHVEVCRGWPRTHPRVWNRAYLAALRRQDLEASVEAREILRVLLRSDGETTRLHAARLLLPKPRPRQAKQRAATEDDREMAEFIKHVRGLCDDEIERLLQESGAAAPASDQPVAAGSE